MVKLIVGDKFDEKNEHKVYELIVPLRDSLVAIFEIFFEGVQVLYQFLREFSFVEAAME